MFRDVLTRIDGVELFAVVPLIAFLVIFIAVIIWTFRLDKGMVRRWSEIPLEQDQDAATREIDS